MSSSQHQVLIDFAANLSGNFANSIKKMVKDLKQLEKSIATSTEQISSQLAATEKTTSKQREYGKAIDETGDKMRRYNQLLEKFGKDSHAGIAAARPLFKKYAKGAEEAGESLEQANRRATNMVRGLSQMQNQLVSTNENWSRWGERTRGAAIHQAELNGHIRATAQGIQILNPLALKNLNLSRQQAKAVGYYTDRNDAFHKSLMKTAEQTRSSQTAFLEQEKALIKADNAIRKTGKALNLAGKNGDAYVKTADRMQVAQNLVNQKIGLTNGMLTPVVRNLGVAAKTVGLYADRNEAFHKSLHKVAQAVGTNTLAFNDQAKALVKADDAIRRTGEALTRYGKNGEAFVKTANRQVIANQLVNKTLTQTNGILTPVAQRMGLVAKQGTILQRAITEVAHSFQSMARYAAGAMVFYQLFNLFRTGTTAIIEYSQGLKDLQAITNATNTDIEMLSETVKQVAADTKYSTTEVVDGMKLLGQAGLDVGEIMASMNHISALATGTLSDFKMTSDLVTTAVRAFQMSFHDTQRIVDVFANAINRSKLSVDKLRVAFNYIAPVANRANMTFEETAAALMLLANAGIRASTMGTGLRRVVIQLIKPNEAFRNAIESAGYAVDDVNPMYNDFADVIDRLTEIVPTAVEAFEFFRVRAAPAVAILVQEGGDALRRFQDVISETGAAARMLETQTEGLGIRFKQVADRFSVFAAALGEAGFEHALGGIADALRVFLNLLIKIAEIPFASQILQVMGLFGAMKLLQGVISVLGGMKIAAWFTSMKTTAAAATVGVTGLKAAFIGLNAVLKANLFLLIASGIITAVGVIRKFNNRVDDATKKIIKQGKEFRNSSEGIRHYQSEIMEASEKNKDWSIIVERLINDFPELAKEIDATELSARELNKAIDKYLGKKIKDRNAEILAHYSTLGEELDKTRRKMELLQATKKQADEMEGKGSFIGIDTDKLKQQISEAKKRVAELKSVQQQLVREVTNNLMAEDDYLKLSQKQIEKHLEEFAGKRNIKIDSSSIEEIAEDIHGIFQNILGDQSVASVKAKMSGVWKEIFEVNKDASQETHDQLMGLYEEYQQKEKEFIKNMGNLEEGDSGEANIAVWNKTLKELQEKIESLENVNLPAIAGEEEDWINIPKNVKYLSDRINELGEEAQEAYDKIGMFRKGELLVALKDIDEEVNEQKKVWRDLGYSVHEVDERAKKLKKTLAEEGEPFEILFPERKKDTGDDDAEKKREQAFNQKMNRRQLEADLLKAQAETESNEQKQIALEHQAEMIELEIAHQRRLFDIKESGLDPSKLQELYALEKQYAKEQREELEKEHKEQTNIKKLERENELLQVKQQHAQLIGEKRKQADIEIEILQNQLAQEEADTEKSQEYLIQKRKLTATQIKEIEKNLQEELIDLQLEADLERAELAEDEEAILEAQIAQKEIILERARRKYDELGVEGQAAFLKIKRELIDLKKELEEKQIIGGGSFFEKVKLGFNRAKKEVKSWGDFTVDTAEWAYTNFSEGFANAFIDFALGAKTAKEAFLDFAGTFLEQIVKMIAQQTFLNAISGFIGGSSSKSAPSSKSAQSVFKDNLQSNYSNFFTKHTGGLVQSISSGIKRVDPSVFVNAPKFHNGGLVKDEIPIIAKKGERVLTPEQYDNMKKEPIIHFNVEVNNEASDQVKTETKQPYFDGKRWVAEMFIQALDTNTGGLRHILGG
ncbi:MAG: phage tail tape measure protein [Bacteroidota bacterium]